MVTRRPEQCVKLDDSFMLAPPDAPLHIRLLHPNVVTTYKVVVQPKVADSNGDTHRKGQSPIKLMHSKHRLYLRACQHPNVLLHAAGDSIVEASYVREWCSFGELQVCPTLWDAGLGCIQLYLCQLAAFQRSIPSIQSSKAASNQGLLQALMDQGGLIEADRETPKLKLILAVAKDVATGLRYLHDRNIVGASLHPSR